MVKETISNDISLSEFKSTVMYLIRLGTMFKFTGGEPTLIPKLKSMLKIVKDQNGIVFLDTNGSRDKYVINLINNNLVDVLGISIKGFNAEVTSATSGVNKEKCWDNVLNVIRKATKHSVRLIITYVAYNDIDASDILDFLNFINIINDKCFFKINNLYGSIHRDKTIKPIKKETLLSMIDEIILLRLVWKGRLIVIEDFDSVQNYEKILFY